MATTASVAIRPSSFAATGLAVLGSASLLALAIVPIPCSIRSLGCVAVVAVSAFAIWRHALNRSRRSTVSIELLPEGKCVLKHSSGERTDGKILADSVAWPWVLLLRVGVSGGRWPVVVLILRDSVSEADWRRLSIWLHWPTSAPNGA